jgi:hypothetical protein
MPHRARENAYGFSRRDDAALRSVSRPAPCGRKESGDDRRRAGRRYGCDCRRGCGGAAVAEPENQAAQQDLTTLDAGPQNLALRYPPAGHKVGLVIVLSRSRT